MVQHWGPTHVTTVPTVQVVNTDPEWFFVEFGIGHEGHQRNERNAAALGLHPKTITQHKPGYKYRVLGRTLDILGTRAVA